VIPELSDVYTIQLPIAANLRPSADDATEVQNLLLSRGIQVTPESVEVYIWPFSTTATSLLPSAEDATQRQSRAASLGVQFTPESVEV
jgi:hypothetical protein